MNKEHFEKLEKDPSYLGAVAFIRVLTQYIPLSAIDTNDFNSNLPRIYITIPYGYNYGGRYKKYERWNKQTAVNAINFYRKYVPDYIPNPYKKYTDYGFEIRTKDKIIYYGREKSLSITKKLVMNFVKENQGIQRYKEFSAFISKNGYRIWEKHFKGTQANPAEYAPGLNGYIGFWKNKRFEIYSDTTLHARDEIAKKYGIKKAYEITVMLAEKDGKPVVHIADNPAKNKFRVGDFVIVDPAYGNKYYSGEGEISNGDGELKKGGKPFIYKGRIPVRFSGKGVVWIDMKFITKTNPDERGMDVAIDFVQGVKAKGHGSISTDGESIYSYSQPIGGVRYINGLRSFWVNIEKYSVTTSKHQGYLRRALTAAGFRAVPGEILNHDGARFQLWS